MNLIEKKKILERIQMLNFDNMVNWMVLLEGLVDRIEKLEHELEELKQNDRRS